MQKQIFIAAGIVIVLGFVGWEFFRSDDDSNPNPANKNTITNATTVATADCAFPVTQAPSLAASYGVPEGWIAEIGNGTLAIMADDRNLTTAFVYTAKLEKDLSAEAFLTEFGGVFKASIEDAGGTFTLGTPTIDGQAAEAVAQATVAEGNLRGVFMVTKEPGFVTFKAYWAPVDAFAQQEPTLKNVLACYQRQTTLTDTVLAAASAAKTATNTPPASPSNPWGVLANGTDGSFTFQMPSSWTSDASSAGESSGLALDAPGRDASVAMLFNLGRYGAADPEEFARTTMAVTYGIQATLSNHQRVGDVDTYDFSGTFNGKSVRGATSVRIEPYQTFFAHYLGVMIANIDKWESYAPTLNTIQASIRLTDAGQQLSSLPVLPKYDIAALFGDNAGAGSSITSGQKYKEEVEDRAAQNWSDAMREYQTMESPSTGDTYDVPLNAYNPTGPNGGGYYRQLPDGGLEQLTPTK